MEALMFDGDSESLQLKSQICIDGQTAHFDL